MAEAACLGPGLVTDSEMEKWLVTASSTTPVQDTEIIFYKSKKSHSIAVPAHLGESSWQQQKFFSHKGAAWHYSRVELQEDGDV